jgi:hypothetical protein
MKQFLAACVVPACIAAVAIPANLVMTSHPAQAAPAQKFQSFQGNGFAIQMPGTPKTETSSVPIGQDQAPVIGYTSHVSANMGYMVMILEMPVSFDPKSKMAQDLLNNMEKDSGKMLKSKVVAKQSFTLSGNPGRELTLSDPDGFGKARIFLVKNRLYMLLAGGKSGQAHKQNIDTFLRSFKLTNQ